MIAARQIAFGRGGTRKPYDAEIEYLESTGTQYIDTGIIPDVSEIIIELKYSNGMGHLFGSRLNSSSSPTVNLLWSLYANTPRVFRLDWIGSTTQITSGDEDSVKTVEFRSDEAGSAVVFGSETYSGIVKTPNALPIAFFAVNTNGTITPCSAMKAVSFKIWKQGILVRDLIPVRVGDVGYMYDKVSGKLFGNQSTGEFVLGPDIIDSTAKDYIQDGLVAMWDGIENAGWGTHDANATVWKDLVGEIDVTANRTPTWRSDAFAGDGGTYFTTNTTVPAHTILNGEYTVELGGRPTGKRKANGGLIGIGTNSSFRTFWMWERQFNYNSFLDSIQTAQIAATQPTTSPDVATSWQAIFDGSMFRLLANGTECINTSARTVAQQESGTYIGKIGNYGSTGSDILFVRLYSRALTADEIAHNYSIDKARFGL